MKKAKSHKLVSIILLFSLATIIFCLYFVKTDQFFAFKNWAQINIYQFSLVLFFIKVLGFVWPPIPGGTLTLGSTAVVGWVAAYAIDFAGYLAGMTLTFFIARKWGGYIVSKILDQKSLDFISKIKIKKSREFEACFVISLLLGFVMAETFGYAAGMLEVKYKNFIAAVVLAHVVQNIPLYYLAGNILLGNKVVPSILIIFVGVFILYHLRKRYFEISSK